MITLDARRSNVDELQFGWFTHDCTDPAAFMNFADDLVDFRVRRGRFGDEFSQEFPDDDGGTSLSDYAIEGKVGAGRGVRSVRRHHHEHGLAGRGAVAPDADHALDRYVALSAYARRPAPPPRPHHTAAFAKPGTVRPARWRVRESDPPDLEARAAAVGEGWAAWVAATGRCHSPRPPSLKRVERTTALDADRALGFTAFRAA